MAPNPDVIFSWGLSWHEVAAGARDVLGLVLAFVGVLLARSAIGITMRQDREEKERLSRRAELTFELFPKNMGANLETMYEVSVYNSGTAKADGFSFSWLMPQEYSTRLQFNPYVRSKQTVSTIEGKSHGHFFGFVDEPLYKNRRMQFANLLVKQDGVDSIVVRWQLTGDDGDWPGNGEFGRLELLDQAKHIEIYRQHNLQAMKATK
jgi:hypothetical protein